VLILFTPLIALVIFVVVLWGVCTVIEQHSNISEPQLLIYTISTDTIGTPTQFQQKLSNSIENEVVTSNSLPLDLPPSYKDLT
jgi:hypothetical protein